MAYSPIFNSLIFLWIQIIFSLNAVAQFTQQGPKLIGTGDIGAEEQGCSVSLSADGNTALIGGLNDNHDTGAAWVFIRSGGVWAQQGAKLVGTGAAGSANQGWAVSLSDDGNTALISGPTDNNPSGNFFPTGAVWVFTRTNEVWAQQGTKLVGSGSDGYLQQGVSVSLSADGNTALIGTPGGYYGGAVWVFIRSGGVWRQQGNKLIGSGGAGPFSGQGCSVSLSADGNTALVGGSSDNNESGAAWVFTRSGEIWTQQGQKLVGTGAIDPARQGFSVSLSDDGNTALVGGNFDNNKIGAVWVFTRSNGVWTQQGEKLVGTGSIGAAMQGSAVSLSSDGNTALAGGVNDSGYNGATWVFSRLNGTWIQQGNKLVGTGMTGAAGQGVSVSLSGDGNTALIGGHEDNGFNGAAWVFTRPGGSLPVDFINITAKKIAKLVQLNWQVATEINIRAYEIERSIDDKSFKTIGIIAANNRTEYKFTDIVAPPGILFYRIKSIGLNGEIKYSSIVKIMGDDDKSGFAISPNPVEGSIFNLQFINKAEGRYMVRLINCTGQVILSTTAIHTGGNSTKPLTIPETAAGGTYQVEIIAPDKIISVKHLFINR